MLSASKTVVRAGPTSQLWSVGEAVKLGDGVGLGVVGTPGRRVGEGVGVGAGVGPIFDLLKRTF